MSRVCRAMRELIESLETAIGQDPADAEESEVLEAKDPIDFAEDFLKLRMKHPALSRIHDSLDKIEAGLAKAQEQEDALKRVGAGGTETHRLVAKHVVPEVKFLADVLGVIAKQMKIRLKG